MPAADRPSAAAELAAERMRAETWEKHTRDLSCKNERNAQNEKGFCFSARINKTIPWLATLLQALPSNSTERLRHERQRADGWRKAAGALSCMRFGVGPNGGFCFPTAITKDDFSRRIEVAQSSCFNHDLAAALASESFAANGSLLDLGCGTGAYGRWIREHAPHVTWLGIDGGENIEEATGGRVRFADLGDGLPRFARRRPFDWVMSVEVAEHLPRSLEPTFVHNLAAPRPKGIVLSWARRGQPGHHHINCQSREYVQCALGLLGYEPDAQRTARLLRTLQHAWAHGKILVRTNCSWLSPNLMAFGRRSGPESGFVPELREQASNQAFSAAYLRLTEARCPLARAAWRSITHRGGNNVTGRVCKGTCGERQPDTQCEET